MLARDLGSRIGEELQIPVYLYGEAALRPDRRDLPAVAPRRVRGPARGDPLESPSGSPISGRRGWGRRAPRPWERGWPLIAFNVNLASRDLQAARAIAREVRESSGGLPAVRAMGVDLPELGAVQVSMNLTDFARTSMLDAFRAVEAAAARRGLAVLHSEVVGLVPRQALPADAESVLKLAGFSADQMLEQRLGID